MECPYCKQPEDSEGCTFHAAGCAGLEAVVLNRLQFDALRQAADAQKSGREGDQGANKSPPTGEAVSAEYPRQLSPPPSDAQAKLLDVLRAARELDDAFAEFGPEPQYIGEYATALAETIEIYDDGKDGAR